MLGLAVVCGALPVREATVQHQGDRYSVRVDAEVRASSGKVLERLTDFDHLDRIDETIVASERLGDTIDGAERVRFQVRTCILFFCFNLTQEADFRTDGQHFLVGHIDPAASDLDYGYVSWTLQPEDFKRTHLVFRAEFEPAFWIPPFIGPWLLERRLKEVATSMVVNLNNLAEAAPAKP